MVCSTVARLRTSRRSSSVRLGVLQCPAMKVSAKPMSPDLRAAVKGCQLCRCRAACGAASPPKRRIVPSGNCSVRLPCCRRCNSWSTARPAAGVPWGMEKEVAVLVFIGVWAQRVVSAVGGAGLVKNGTRLANSFRACQWMRNTTPSVMAG